MEDIQTDQEILFRIEEVRTTHFEFSEPVEEPQRENWPDFTISVGFRVDFEENTIWVRVSSEAEDEGEKLIEIQTETGYKIKNIQDLPHDEESIEIPDEFGLNLASMAVSTTRGILIEKTSSTTLSKLILPPVNPGVLISDDEDNE
jgi:hypothetical protein